MPGSGAGTEALVAERFRFGQVAELVLAVGLGTGGPAAILAVGAIGQVPDGRGALGVLLTEPGVRRDGGLQAVGLQFLDGLEPQVLVQGVARQVELEHVPDAVSSVVLYSRVVCSRPWASAATLSDLASNCRRVVCKNMGPLHGGYRQVPAITPIEGATPIAGSARALGHGRAA